MEDPYDILQVPSGADDAEIRQAYVRAVRRSPPEQDPEGFSRVRQAYEELSDPSRRALRDWGPELKRLMEEAQEKARQGRRAEAIVRLKRCLVICPEHVPARAALARGWLAQGRFREAVREADRLARRPPPSGEWLVLAAEARRRWAEQTTAPPRRVRRLVKEARALLERAQILGEEPEVEFAHLHLLAGEPERALEILSDAGGDAAVLRLRIHLDRCDDGAFREEVARLEEDEGVGLQVALLARARALKGDFRALRLLVAAAEELAPSSDLVETVLTMPNELLLLLQERQRVPTARRTLRRLIGLEIDDLRLPAGRDQAILDHWNEVVETLQEAPFATRQAWVRDLRLKCPTFCERNPQTLELLEAP